MLVDCPIKRCTTTHLRTRKASYNIQAVNAQPQIEGIMKLYEIALGIYPRRVGIYSADKGLTDIGRIHFHLYGGWPSPVITSVNPGGTVPGSRPTTERSSTR